MIYDRPYMRSDFERREVSALTWILAITIGGYVVQSILRSWFHIEIDRFLGLSIPALSSGFVWTPITYGLLHAVNPLHLIFNLIGVYFLGREVLPMVGNRRFVWIYLGALLLGGLAWLPISILAQGAAGGPVPVLIGCSATVFALLTVFACFHPDKPITLLLFFVIPVTIRPRILAYIAAGASAFFLLFFEVLGRSAVAHSSHLGGMLAGWLYYRYLHQRTGEFGSARTSIELPSWMKRKKKAAAETSFKVNITHKHDIKAEVDRILDKINSQGFGALTEDERRILDSARDVLNKR